MKRLQILLLCAMYSQMAFSSNERDTRYPIDTKYDSSIKPGYLIGTITNLHNIIDTCKINPSEDPIELINQNTLEDVKYKKIFGHGLLSEFESDSDMLAITMVDNGVIVRQKYFKERTPNDFLPSFSMSKSLIALLIGVAYDEGVIESLEDKANKYSKNLEGNSYGEIKIINLLRMGSGIPFSENYVSNSDIAQFSFGTIGPNSDVVNSISKFNRRSEGEGQKFNYASIETAVLAEILREKVGNLCRYFEKKIWQRLGAKSSAYWAVDSKGKVPGHAFFMSQQNDFIKIGVMLANEGLYNKQQIISKKYLSMATVLELQPTPFKVGKVNQISGYGFQFWISPIDGVFSMWGVRGQRMYVDRVTKKVMLINSAWDNHLDRKKTYKIDQIFKSYIGRDN